MKKTTSERIVINYLIEKEYVNIQPVFTKGIIKIDFSFEIQNLYKV